MGRVIAEDISEKGNELFYLTKVLNSPEMYCLTIPGAHGVFCNSYILQSNGEVLVIDPPLKDIWGYQIFERALKSLLRGDGSIQVFFTHFHTECLKEHLFWLPEGTRVYLSGYGPLPEEMEKALSYQIVRYRKEGYPKELLKAWNEQKDIASPVLGIPREEKEDSKDICTITLEDGDRISMGKWELACLYTPGHTQGHVCLELKEKGMLFSGDTVLFDDLPFAGIWKGKKSALDYLLESLKRLEKENYRLIFPAHGTFNTNGNDRVKDIINRYYYRILEMYRLVYDHPEKNAYQLSQLFCRCGEACKKESLKKQWHAMGETLAYLVYLRERKFVSSNRSENGMVNVPGKRKITDY